VAGVALAGAVALGGGAASADNTSYNWGGLYFGANVGWMGADVDWRFLTPSPTSPTAVSHNYDNGILGGHVGIQHQFGMFVIGIEAAYSGTGAFGQNRKETNCAFINPFTVERCDTRAVDSLFTIGPRFGWAPNSKWLVFLNGGFASARIETQLRTLDPVAFNGPEVFASASRRHDGWYIGGGVEHALTPNWILGLEYQRVGLGAQTHCGANFLNRDCLPPSSSAEFLRRIDADIDIVRARVSYKIGRREPEALK
jgi:outer membrane immunogenic protein